MRQIFYLFFNKNRKKKRECEPISERGADDTSERASLSWLGVINKAWLLINPARSKWKFYSYFLDQINSRTHTQAARSHLVCVCVLLFSILTNFRLAFCSFHFYSTSIYSNNCSESKTMAFNRPLQRPPLVGRVSRESNGSFLSRGPDAVASSSAPSVFLFLFNHPFLTFNQGCNR